MKFIDPKLNEQFEKDGYCKLPLLQDEQIQALRQFAKSQLLTKEILNTDYGMYVSLEESPDLKSKALKSVQESVVPLLSEHLQDYQIHLGGYLIKAPDHSKYTFPHQDWTFIDNQTNDVSATVWISLYDLDEKNGTLGFLKGSHQFLDFVIGSPSPAVPTPLMGKEAETFPYLKFEPVKAGDALIFNNKTIHAAQPNCGDFFRIAVGVGITPANSSLFHYFLNPENDSEFLKLKVEEQFYMTYNNDDLYSLYQQKKTPEFCEVVGKLPVARNNYPDLDTVLSKAIECQNIKTNNSIDFSLHFPQQESKTEELAQAEEQDSTGNHWEDNRTFFQKYTPLNIYREARSRLNLISK